MDCLGSQVGQKMRSAIKAKLIELGSGGTAGYIDDELPDYVMIMVANKRSKQQMIADLSLFLDAHTELFVTWLHEVLQKLEEVTLPAAVTQNMKRKSSVIEAVINSKKERKERRKEKKLKRSTEKGIEVVSPSIPNAFVNQLLQKAKQSVPLVVATKNELLGDKNNTDEFDIPTITEISGQNSARTSRKLELNEFTELQKKIMQAKRHLKNLETDESEDEDFLSIKEDVEELDYIVGDKLVKKVKDNYKAVCNTQISNAAGKENKKHVPIIYDKKEEESNHDNGLYKKKSIHERLGYKSVPKTDIIKSFEKKRAECNPCCRSNKDNDKLRNKYENSKNDENSDNDNQKKCIRLDVRRKIGSRIIIAPPKSTYKQDDNITDKSLNSLIKVKPRPSVSPSKQASKNLLLRAVAEAQKSTALIKPREKQTYLKTKNAIPSRVQKLYTKSHRDKNRKALRKTSAKDNIVIKVNINKEPISGIKNLQDDEYIPEPISDRGDSDNDYVYIPQIINSSLNNFSYECKTQETNTDNKTQFVVTLDDKSQKKYNLKHNACIADKSLEKIENKDPAGSSFERIDLKKQDLREKNNKENANFHSKLKETSISTKNYDIDINESKKLLKSNSKGKDLISTVSKEKTFIKIKRSAVSPIKFNLNTKKDPKRKLGCEEMNKRNSLHEIEDKKKGTQIYKTSKKSKKISTKIPEILRKYENIPELNDIPVDSSAIKTKSKERCKYFPSCGKGDSCEFFHPVLPCKAFPVCKFAEKCLYVHPQCKFDLTCNRISCNFSHTATVGTNVAPPLSSHVVPVQNYKSISATPIPTMCKYYPKCANTMCNFYHPKLCRFGKNCMNKVECNFFHHDVPNNDKFKWVASSV